MTDRTNTVTTPGGGIASRIARIVADAIVHTRAETAPTLTRVGTQIFTEATNHVSDEVRGVMGPIFRQAAKSETTSPELKALFTALGTGRGQAWAWIGGTATGAAMGGGLMNLLTNELNGVILPLIAANPHGILSPGDAATAEARGLAGPPDWPTEAAKSGIDENRFRALVALAHTLPALGELLELVRRGDATPEWAMGVLRRSGYSGEHASALLELRHTLMSPQDAASAWARNVISADQVRALAVKAGLTPQDGDTFMELAGEPPDLTSIIMAWRRGIITEAQVDRAIVQGPLRNEWIPVAKALYEDPLSPEVAASAVTQGILTEAAGAAKAALSGISAEDFHTVVEVAGLPPGIEFAAEAFARGLITDDQWAEMFLQSRIKNKYVPLMRAMRTNLIPADTVRMMYRLGVYPADNAVQTLQGHGYTEVDAKAMLALEDVRKHESTKDLSASQVIGLYVDELVTRDDAAAMLTDAGYDQQEADWRVAMADVDKMRRHVNAVITRVRAAYVQSRIPVNEAITLLDSAGVSPGQRDNLIALWDIEASTVSESLTTAQIQAAMKKGLIQPQGAYERLLGRGYSPDDAAILVELAGGQLPAEIGG